MVRGDFGTIYNVSKGTDTFSLFVWVSLGPTDDNFPKEVLDSFSSLKMNGYKLTQLDQYVYENVDCDLCLEVRKKNLSTSCSENN